MRRWLLVLGFLLCAARVSAQPAPTIVSTLQTTNTSTTSLQVGCAVGSSVCTGGIVAGPIIGSALGAESGYVEIQSNVPVSQTNRLVNNNGTLQWNSNPLAIGGSISGATNTIPVFTGTNSIGNSIMTQSGTTITVANTLSATTLTGTLSTVSQPNVTTMAALASIGTITTGVWNGTAVGVQWGGTGSNLSGTGGTSQFLRQASVGAAITVVRPAVADLSDNSNVALLNANNIFTAVGTQTIGSGTTGTNQETLTLNGGSGSNAGSSIVFQRNTVNAGFIGTSSSIVGGSSSDILLYGASGNGVTFYTNALQRWGINSAGDFTFGASGDIADSSGVPTGTAASCTSGSTPTVAANSTDYAMTVAPGGGTNSACTWTFGHTWTHAPVCVAMEDNLTANITPLRITTATNALNIFWTSSSNTTSFFVLCRGS